MAPTLRPLTMDIFNTLTHQNRDVEEARQLAEERAREVERQQSLRDRLQAAEQELRGRREIEAMDEYYTDRVRHQRLIDYTEGIMSATQAIVENAEHMTPKMVKRLMEIIDNQQEPEDVIKYLTDETYENPGTYEDYNLQEDIGDDNAYFDRLGLKK